MDNNNNDSGSNVCTVNFVCPPFWSHDPALWFLSLEAQFHVKHVTSQSTKYFHVLSALPPEVISTIADIAKHPPEDRPYDALKASLLNRLDITDRERVRRLLHTADLGDRKPTQLLRYMRSLIGSFSVDDNFLKEMWFQRLPTQLQANLVVAQDRKLDSLAELADTTWELYQAPSLPSTTTSDSRIANIENELATLRSSLGRVHLRGHSRSPSPTTSRKRPQAAPVCWYHAKYGNDARQCRPPCRFYKKKSGNGRADD